MNRPPAMPVRQLVSTGRHTQPVLRMPGSRRSGRQQHASRSRTGA